MTVQPREYGPLHRVWRSFAYNVLAFGLRRPYLTVDVPWLGLSLRCGSQDMLGRKLFKVGLYEADVTGFVLRYLSAAPQDVVFDVGANVGYYSLLTNRVCGEGVPVHAVEAEPGNLALLRENVARANAGSITTHGCAVSDERGRALLHLWKESNRGKHSLIPFDGDDGARGAVEVPVRTLDDLADELGLAAREVSLLKIDIEGGEHRAFLGARRLLARSRVVLSEISPRFLARSGTTVDEHVAFLCGMGFSLFEIASGGSVRGCSVDDLRQATRARNVVYVRNDQLDEPWAVQCLLRE